MKIEKTLLSTHGRIAKMAIDAAVNKTIAKKNKKLARIMFKDYQYNSFLDIYNAAVEVRKLAEYFRKIPVYNIGSVQYLSSSVMVNSFMNRLDKTITNIEDLMNEADDLTNFIGKHKI